jgi:hypothetical protein
VELRDRRTGTDRRSRKQPLSGSERRRRERRRIDFGAPKPGAIGHLADLIFFRSIGVGILWHEVVGTPTSEWSVMMAGLAMFFMPDALRGRNSLGARLVLRWLLKAVDGQDEE